MIKIQIIAKSKKEVIAVALDEYKFSDFDFVEREIIKTSIEDLKECELNQICFISREDFEKFKI